MNELQRLEESYKEMGKRIEDLRAKKSLPKSLKELHSIDGWCFIDSEIYRIYSGTEHESHKNIFATEEQAKASIALAQLSQLIKAYNGDWVPDWANSQEKKYTIYFSYNQISIGWNDSPQRFLVFKTEELRDEFLNNFRDLIMEAKPLL